MRRPARRHAHHCGVESVVGGPLDRGRFRLDLFYRLNGIDVQVPPLRCRRDDIIELARYFLDRHRTFRPLLLSTAAADALLTYDWPGNVRELERVVERAVALASGSSLELDDLPPAILGGYADVLLPAYHAKSMMRAWASRYARLVLERCGNNKRKSCRELGISYHTLQAYLRSPAAADAPAPTRRSRPDESERLTGGGQGAGSSGGRIRRRVYLIPNDANGNACRQTFTVGMTGTVYLGDDPPDAGR